MFKAVTVNLAEFSRTFALDSLRKSQRNDEGEKRISMTKETHLARESAVEHVWIDSAATTKAYDALVAASSADGVIDRAASTGFDGFRCLQLPIEL